MVKSENHIPYFLHKPFTLRTLKPLANTAVMIAFHPHHRQRNIVKGPGTQPFSATHGMHEWIERHLFALHIMILSYTRSHQESVSNQSH